MASSDACTAGMKPFMPVAAARPCALKCLSQNLPFSTKSRCFVHWPVNTMLTVVGDEALAVFAFPLAPHHEISLPANGFPCVGAGAVI